MLLYMYIILYNENNDIIAGLQRGTNTHFWVREVFVVRGRHFQNWPRKGNITHKSKYIIKYNLFHIHYSWRLLLSNVITYGNCYDRICL